MNVRSSFFPLVESGIRPPFFIASSDTKFRHLSRGLGPEQPCYQLDVYALQEERLSAGEPLLTTVEDMAARFINDIISVQPSGPYFLSGQCEGSIIALEIARQLRRQGHQIAALMQFDTPATGYWVIPPWHRRVLEAFRRGEFLVRLVRNIRYRFWRKERLDTPL